MADLCDVIQLQVVMDRVCCVCSIRGVRRKATSPMPSPVTKLRLDMVAVHACIIYIIYYDSDDDACATRLNKLA